MRVRGEEKAGPYIYAHLFTRKTKMPTQIKRKFSVMIYPSSSSYLIISRRIEIRVRGEWEDWAVRQDDMNRPWLNELCNRKESCMKQANGSNAEEVKMHQVNRVFV